MATKVSQFINTLQPDSSLVQDASYTFDPPDRQYIDQQVINLQALLSTSLLNAVVSSFYMTGDTVNMGDVLCLAPSAVGLPLVVTATAANMASAVSITGIALTAAAPGALVQVAIGGDLPQSITGLNGAEQYVRVSSTGRPQEVSAYTVGDYPVGTVNSSGVLSIARDVRGATQSGSSFTSLTVTGNAAVGGTLGVTGACSLASGGGTVTAGGNLSCTGNVSCVNLAASGTIVGSSTLAITGTSSLTGPVTCGGALGCQAFTATTVSCTTISCTGVTSTGAISGTTVTASGAVNCGSVACSGTGLFEGALETFSTLAAVGAVTCSSTLSVAGASTLVSITAPTFPTNSSTAPALAINGAHATGTTSTGGDIDLIPGTGTSAAGNVALFGQAAAGGGTFVLYIANRAVAPTSNPTGGGVLYAEAGALKWKGSSGTVTTIAPA